MKQLPVPGLSDTLARYLAAVEPLVDSRQRATTAQAVAHFAAGPGPRCQAALEEFAVQEQAAGRSWLSQAWLDTYLAVRTPLPLTSSVGFRIAWPAATSGLERVAEVVCAFADAHLAYLRGEVEPEVTPRGEPVDPAQWDVTAGGLRHPRPGQDESRLGRADAANREVGVLWRGHYFAIPISDQSGQPFDPSAMMRTFAQVVAFSAADQDFSAWSNLGSERVAEILDQLLADPANRATYDRLSDALFVVRIGDEVADEAEHLRRGTFEPGQAWAYKPLTYQVQLADEYVAVHVEHSRIDGATLRSLIQRAQSAASDPGNSASASTEVQVPVTELSWVMAAALRSALDRELAEHQSAVQDHRVRIERVANPVPPGTKISLDAVQQWLMLFAQWATYGQVRSTYEAVDMREYEAGRTECLRPNTSQAVALVQALADGTAEPAHVQAALQAHRESVKAAKSGNGIDRHLTGLGFIGKRLGLSSSLHEDEAYRLLTTDFLSTTSLGDRGEIHRCGFAPTSPGGIGFYYAPDGDCLEFTLSYVEGATERIADVARNLHRGAQALAGPLAALAATG